ncbi:MAG: outer membrane protein assembly factor BamD [Desulfobacterales bacterium]|nr:outer membrane protein assembly factor BamD [Desulfobacterales bacterium]
MKRLIFLSLIVLLAVSGCAWFGSKEEKTAQELASDGMDQYNNKDYKDAIKSFEKLKDWYPFSKYAILAELKIGDAHYRLEEYEDAVAAYENFESLHPRNEAIPYVIYQIGLCYFERIDTIDRDQSSAQKAVETFERLRKQFPKDPYSIKAEELIKKCQRSLSGNDFYVGLFYYKSKHYKAALERFKSVLTNYPDVGVHQKALQYIILCEELINAESKQDKDKK